MSTSAFLIVYVLIINLLTVVYFYRDKRKAVRHEFRTPESVLFLLAAMGGSPGALFSMYTFHHKTRKWKFRIGIPAILILQLLLIILFIYSAESIALR